MAAELGGEAWAVDLAATTALDDLTLDVDILVNNAGIQRVSPIRGVRSRGVPPDPAAHGRVAVPADPRGAAHDVRARLGAHRQHLERARAAGEPVQVGVRRGQARPRGPVEGHRTRGGTARSDEQLHQPRLRPYAPRREADRRPGAAARHPRERGGREGHADRERDQAARRGRPRSRRWPAGSSPTRPAWSRAPRTRWTAGGPRDDRARVSHARRARGRGRPPGRASGSPPGSTIRMPRPPCS